MSQREPMTIEIWSDVVCSWCYIGMHHLARALAEVPDRAGIACRWRSFELDPQMPADGGLADDELARRRGITLEEARVMHEVTERQGAELGIHFDFRRARRGNTFEAHRVLQMAHDHGLQDAVNECLMATFFSGGGAIDDRSTLADAAAQAGMDRAAVVEMLESDRYALEVRADEREASELGIDTVPFFVLDRRFGLAGAQPPAVLGRAIEQARADQRRMP